MHEESLNGVADAGTLGLGIEEDFHRHVFTGGFVNEDMDVALAGLDDGYGRIVDHGLDQVPAAAGNQYVHPAAGPHQDVGPFTAELVHALDGVRGQAH